MIRSGISSQRIMLYKSTRGGERGKSFEDVLLATYAIDGGLYVPEEIPMIKFDQLCSWASYSFGDVCAEVMHLFTGIDTCLLREMCAKAFQSFNNGSTDAPLPMKKFGDLILLDASLGPTLSFKDIGQQMVAQLLNFYLSRRQQTANIVVETSGDTGPAAIAGVRGCANVNIFCLYPHNRVSAVQEMQMISVHDANVHVYRTDGDSDEQASVLKELFCDASFVRENNICSINSINWARIAVQSTYYIWAYLQIYNSRFSIGQRVSFCIPTGAFGNAMGGFLAKRMGLPIDRIVCATNSNDIVARTISRGDLRMGSNLPTVSPAMDIQFAYNLERLLYFICNENTSIVRDIMVEVERQYSYEPGTLGVQLDPLIIQRIQSHFSTCSVSDDATLETIRRFHDLHGFTLCPHSAIGVHAGLNVFQSMAAQHPMVCVLTAHPAKFEETVKQAIGTLPASVDAVEKMKLTMPRFEWLRKSTPDWRSEWIRRIKNDIVSSST